MRTGKVASVALALALLAGTAAACTSDPDEPAGGGSGGDDNSGEGDGGAGGSANPTADSTTGLSDDTLKLGVIGVDFGALAQAGLTPDLGDQPKIFQSVVDQINADGGIGGRQVELRLTMIDVLAGAESGQAACLEMTQDFGAFAVVLTPAVSRDVARCVAVSNETLTLGSTGFDDALYEEAEGRLFSAGSDTSMSTDRQAEGWARMLDEDGVLEGKTIGVVTDEQSPEFSAAANDSLVPTLEELGYEVPVNVTLPCPEGDQDCDQQEAAVQQMKDAGVDFVFMGAANTVGPTFVQAAENLDFHPEWAANGNQVTDTVAQFFASVSDAWDGAVGTSTVFAELDDLTDEAYSCNEAVTEQSGEEYEPGSDAFGFAASTCLVVRLLDGSGDEIAPEDLTQGTMIGGIEGLGEVVLNAGPPGTLSADKHDAGDNLFLSDYDAGSQEFVQRDGDPVKVD
jgi:ABC-type branched-subunit amino acid transport system substrate-binding protein